MKLSLLLLASGLCAVLQNARGERGPKPFSELFKLSLSKRAATKFSSSSKSFWFSKEEEQVEKGKEGMDEECCGGGSGGHCSWERRCEYAERYEWGGSNQFLCELSIKEKKSCTCRARKGFDYECASQSYTTECICEPGYNYCGTGRQCYHESYHCDSVNNCGNWKDEEGCEIRKGQSANLVGGIQGVSGNVMIGGRYVCDHSWDSNDAKVVCKMLGSSNQVKVLSTSGSYFGEVSNFRMDNVQCRGSESHIHDCGHTTISRCGSNNGAGVHCVEPTSFRLHPKQNEAKNEGYVYLGHYSACSAQWHWKDSQVACKQLYNSQDAIPVFAVNSYEFSSQDKFAINTLGCTGAEARLTDCPHFSINKKDSCSSNKRVHIQCAKCITKDLVKILKIVKVSNDLAETEKSVDIALKTLKSQCYDWDCTKTVDGHTSFCKTRATLTDLKVVLENRNKPFKLSNKFNEVKSLQHNFIKSEFGKLRDQVNGLSKVMTDFQKSLAQYFVDSAAFDETRLEGEITSLISVLDETEKGRDEEEKVFKSTVKKITDVITVKAAASITMNIFKIGFKVASVIVDPTKALSIGSELGEIMNQAGKISDVRFLANLVPKFTKTSEGILTRMKENEGAFIALNGLLRDKEEMNITKAKKFATMTIQSPYKATDMSDMQVYFETIVDGLCDMLKDGDGIPIITSVKKSCLDAKFRAGRVIGYHEKMHETFLSMANYVKDIAKNKLQISLSQNMAKTLETPLTNEVTIEVARIQSMILLRLQKFRLIFSTCERIKYMSHNIELPVCKSLQKNMDGDLGKLMSYEFTRDMCADSVGGYEYKNIPISFNNSDQNGFNFDLTALFDSPEMKTQMYFQIPNIDWLVKNDWMDKETSNSGPFYLRGMQVILPPIFVQKGLRVTTTVSLVKNEPLEFEDRFLARTDVHENALCSSTTELVNPYDTPGCLANEPLCMSSVGEFAGPMYPSLFGQYRITFRLNKPYSLDMITPSTKFYLKARVDLCYNDKTTGFVEKVKPHQQSGVCCAKRKQYYSIENELAGKEPCRACPGRSIPYLNGYCCVEFK